MVKVWCLVEKAARWETTVRDRFTWDSFQPCLVQQNQIFSTRRRHNFQPRSWWQNWEIFKEASRQFGVCLWRQTPDNDDEPSWHFPAEKGVFLTRRWDNLQPKPNVFKRTSGFNYPWFAEKKNAWHSFWLFGCKNISFTITNKITFFIFFSYIFSSIILHFRSKCWP